MDILELREVGYTYRTQYQQVEALRGVSRGFGPGAVHAIMGRSGSGKTTLLSLMAGLDLPTAGQVLFEGAPTSEMNLEKYRREKAAVIYQNFRLFPLLTVAENVMYPMELRGTRPKQAKEKAAALVERVGLPASALDRFPTMLSGGEQQRVAIARALGMETKLLLADEPTGNLDTANGENVLTILEELARKEGYTWVLIVMCIVREFLGNGTFAGGFSFINNGDGIRILPEGIPALGMILPVGGFLTLGCFIAFMQWRTNKAKEAKKDEKKEEAAA